MGKEESGPGTRVPGLVLVLVLALVIEASARLFEDEDEHEEEDDCRISPAGAAPGCAWARRWLSPTARGPAGSAAPKAALRASHLPHRSPLTHPLGNLDCWSRFICSPQANTRGALPALIITRAVYKPSAGKAEGRNPKAERRPKSEIRSAFRVPGFGLLSAFGFRPSALSSPTLC